jgi:hypothetical protein
MLAELQKAFSVGVPVIGIDTQDPSLVISKVSETFINAEKPAGILVWDCVRGITFAANDKLGQDAASKLGSADDYAGSPITILEAIGRLPRRVLILLVNAHKFIEDIRVIQAIWNARDELKSSKKMLVLLGCGSVPRELQHDVIIFDHPLPTVEDLKSVIGDVCNWAEVQAESDQIEAGAKAAIGVTTFAAENLAAMAVTRGESLDLESLWKSKRKKIDATPGLQVVSGQEGFESIGGCEAFKLFMRRVLNGKDRPNAIVYIDEIEKSLGGSSSDTSGVSQDQLGQLLSWMQDHQATGVILVGPPGAAKSAGAKASGVEGKIPTIQLDLGGTKGSLVGESEAKIRDALKVIDAVSGGKTLWIATCNSLTDLPPELKRRFKLGTWYFDLPVRAEREKIWELYVAKMQLDDSFEDLLDEEWTGAEIQSCCELSSNLGITLQEASAYIVPVSKAASETISRLRSGAEGRFLSASEPGTYQRRKATTGRAVD